MFTLIFQGGPAVAQNVKSFIVRLQDVTPGDQQTGHSNITGKSIAGQFQGDGSLLTGLNGSTISSGTVPDARLSTNIPLLNGVGQTFTTGKTFSASPSFTNATTPFLITSTNRVGNLNADLLDNQTGSFYQDATNLNAGTVPDARLSSNVATLNTNQTITGQKVFSQFPSFSNVTPFIVTSNQMVGNLNVQFLNGQAGGFYTNATNLTTGLLSDSRLSTNVATLAGAQTFAGQKTFSSNLKLPTGAQNGHVLTSDATGTASWQTPFVPTGAVVVSASQTPPSGYTYTGISLKTEPAYESISTMPVMHDVALCGLGTKVYVVGRETVGEGGISRFFSFDVLSGVTTQLAPPLPYSELMMVAGQSIVYAVETDDKSFGRVFTYNPSSNVWTQATVLPFDSTIRKDWSIGTILNDLMVFGGQHSATGQPIYTSYMWRAGAWSAKGNMNSKRINCGPLSVNGTIFAFGGGTEAVEAYVDFTNSWVYAGQTMPARFDKTRSALFRRNGVDEFAAFDATRGYKFNVTQNQWADAAALAFNTNGIYAYELQLYFYSGGLKRFPLPDAQFLHKKT